MLDLEPLWIEIESEQTWRFDEIRFFQNMLETFEDSENKRKFRKVLVLMLYAHYEGFCKFAFEHYVKAVNSLGLKCSLANSSLAAAALAKVFNNLRNPSKKCDLFRRALPDDSGLHKFARDKEFIDQISEFSDIPLLVEDKIIDTGSNLKPEILQKILFSLGFPHTLFDHLKPSIQKLLNFRNRIAHGEAIDGITQRDYETLRNEIFEIMDDVKKEVMKALQDQKFLK